MQEQENKRNRRERSRSCVYRSLGSTQEKTQTSSHPGRRNLNWMQRGGGGGVGGGGRRRRRRRGSSVDADYSDNTEKENY